MLQYCTLQDMYLNIYCIYMYNTINNLESTCIYMENVATLGIISLQHVRRSDTCCEQ